jgi:hypothetical protein
MNDEFTPEIFISKFISTCYMDDFSLGNRDWKDFPSKIEEAIYAITPLFIDYPTWMSYTDRDREKMRGMWSKYSYKKAKNFLGGSI